jgi:cytochrome d ubiquinol oxidase subunit I
LTLGGIPDDATMEMRFAVQIPGGLSLLAHHDAEAVVTGLEAFPRDEWPNVRAVHFGFQVMVAAGTALLAVAAWGGWLAVRHRRLPDGRWFLRACVAATPLGFVAIEAGWIVTEMGRQPWIIYRVMRTADAVTPMPGLVVPFTVFTGVYMLLTVILVLLLRRGFMETSPPRPDRDAA